MKSGNIKAIGYAAFASMALLAAGAHAQTTVLRFNLWLPPTMFIVTDFVGGWAKEVEKATDGRVRVENTATSLGAPARQYQLAVDGIADLVWGSHNYSAGQFPLDEIMGLPQLSEKAEPASVAYWRVYEKHFKPTGQYKEVKLIGIHAQAPGQLLLFNDRPIRSIDDLKGQKIRSVSGNMAAIIERLGAAPVSIPANEIYLMASRGVIDGMQFSAESAVAMKLDPFIKQIITMPGGYYNSSFYMVMNKKKWEGISAADQARIDAVSNEYFARRVGRAWDRQVEAAYEKLRKQGTKVIPASPDLVARVSKEAASLEQAYIKDVAKLGVDGAAAIKMLKQEIANYRGN
jgi:TRAP-type C4-dicarboxylate transport system substrate-binding protein